MAVSPPAAGSGAESLAPLPPSGEGAPAVPPLLELELAAKGEPPQLASKLRPHATPHKQVESDERPRGIAEDVKPSTTGVNQAQGHFGGL